MAKQEDEDDAPPSPSANESRKRKRTSSNADEASPMASLESPGRPTTEELLEYLDENIANGLFTVNIQKQNRKQKRKLEDISTIGARFGTHLDVQWEVQPGNIWENMKKFKKFTVGDLSIAQGDCVYVKHDETTAEGSLLETEEQWKAMVIETRAVDGNHVYILVAWMNRPEDLPGGRKPHHGRYELIPTNQLDIIDANSVNGKVSLISWEDAAKEKQFNDQYFWRQTYDFAYTRKFSPIKPICVEEQVSNPDVLVVQCENPKCSKWLHWDCIAKSIIKGSSNKSHRSSVIGRLLSSVWSQRSGSQQPGFTLSGIFEQNGYRVELLLKNTTSTTIEAASKAILEDDQGNRQTLSSNTESMSNQHRHQHQHQHLPGR